MVGIGMGDKDVTNGVISRPGLFMFMASTLWVCTGSG
jgi:hypothetical protein